MCRESGCKRAPLRSSGGSLYPYCDDHTRRILREAFAPEPRSWHERAKAHSLPTAIVGGIAA